jgi:hypothetical protein
LLLLSHDDDGLGDCHLRLGSGILRGSSGLRDVAAGAAGAGAAAAADAA